MHNCSEPSTNAAERRRLVFIPPARLVFSLGCYLAVQAHQCLHTRARAGGDVVRTGEAVPCLAPLPLLTSLAHLWICCKVRTAASGPLD